MAGRSMGASVRLRRSRLVLAAKVGLPLAAVALVGAVVIWPLVESGSHDRATTQGGQPEMVDARFLGVDQSARPFEVRARRVLQTPGDAQLMTLVEPEAEITLGREWVTVGAEAGQYDQTKGHLDLSGKVTLFHDSGHEFRTGAAQVDTADGIVWGNRPVEGEGPVGDIAAGGFRILDGGDTIVFTGKARLVLDRVASGRPPEHSDAAAPGGRP